VLIKIDGLTLPALSPPDTGTLTTIRTHESAMISIGVNSSATSSSGKEVTELKHNRFYPRRIAPQFLPAAVMTASLIASISASPNVAFCGVRVMVTASDF